MADILKPHSIVHGKNKTTVVYETSKEELAAKMDMLDDFLRELCANPKEAMVVAYQWARFMEDKYGCRMESTENPPQ